MSSFFSCYLSTKMEKNPINKNTIGLLILAKTASNIYWPLDLCIYCTKLHGRINFTECHRGYNRTKHLTCLGENGRRLNSEFYSFHVIRRFYCYTGIDIVEAVVESSISIETYKF